ncbi:MAG: 2,3-bisphosphoglycerate-independent phosphoglycerate mutase [Proteobacteria bacterium]|nr:2,3-bisphosphoglycerate-independent phosphoglycerate mutase [Pseudomonadota bacterium]
MLKKPGHRYKPVVLCILDGWGHADAGPNNAIFQARTPTYDRWWKTYPRAFLKTSGEAVGLPEGQMGNSEVGHMNIGAGRVVKQDLPRIDKAITSGEFEKNPVLKETLKKLKDSGGTLHLMGLVSPGGVHSHQDHMKTIAGIFSSHGIAVNVHAFLDGRDTPPKSALSFVEDFEKPFLENDLVRIVTVAGRYYAMDRDRRWDRVRLAFEAMAEGKGRSCPSALAAIEALYANNETDEFALPAVIGHYSGMEDGDALLMANFRADRARQILAALVDPDFDGFERKFTPKLSARAGMVAYSSDLDKYMIPLFDPIEVKDSLGELVSKAGLKQLRIAETEKYAHVTFFFNGGEECPFKGEDRILIPSPKVATYDLKPEMSAHEVTANLVQVINDDTYDFIVVNFANPDMVGHTGNLKAAIQAVEVIDDCLGKIEQALQQANGVMLLSADHGNIEQMQDPDTKAPHTAHTTTDVPVILVGIEGVTLKNGSLADIAPTLLGLLSLEQPLVMTGHSLLQSETVKK